MRQHVRPSDSVLELGCHEGVTTRLAQTLCGGAVVGVDSSEFTIGKARARWAGEAMSFARMDAFDAGAVRALFQRQAGAGKMPSVVLIDVSGSRAAGDVCELIGKYDRACRPRVIIVKAFKLYSLIVKAEGRLVGQSVRAPERGASARRVGNAALTVLVAAASFLLGGLRARRRST